LSRQLPLTEPIDLLNVAFENPRSLQAQTPKAKKTAVVPLEGVTGSPQDTYSVPDRITGIQELEELRRSAPDRIWNFASVSSPGVLDECNQ